MQSTESINSANSRKSSTFPSFSNATLASPALLGTGTSSNGSIAASAASCQAAQVSYNSVSASWVANTANLKVITQVVVTTSTFTFTTTSVSQTAYITLCDGVPRGLGTPRILTNVSLSLSSADTTSTFSRQLSPPASPPACRIDPSDRR